MNSSKVTLGYWKIRGFGEPARTLLEYLEIPYDQELYETFDEWIAAKTKSTHLFPNLPYLKDGEKVITESQAVYYYICLKGNRPDMTGKEADKVEFLQLQTLIIEVHDKIIGPVYDSKDVETLKKKLSHSELDKKGGLNSFQISYMLGGLNEILSKREWLLGYLTFLDFYLAECIEKFLTIDEELGTNILTDDPNIKEHLKRFLELPAIKAYRQSERFQKRPFNVPDYKPLWT